MKVPTKFVKPLTDEQRKQLKEIMKSQTSERRRMRAHAVLLSDRRYSINKIADSYQVDRDRVSVWLQWWDEHALAGLDDDPRGGRPKLLNEAERERAIELVKEEPRQLKRGLLELTSQIGKVISADTLKSILRDADYVWKRLRRSLRGKRDEAEFRLAEAELLELRAADVAGRSKSELWYMDQAGFTLEPCVPDAWQLVGETLELASSRSRRQNVIGFLNLRSQFHSFAFEGTIDTSVVLECLYLFSRQIDREALVVIDNAPIHTSEEFESELAELQKRGVMVKYLPAYSPELNLIEILWRKIKYEWLPLDAYQDFKTMTQALFEILKGVGSKYRITFA